MSRKRYKVDDAIDVADHGSSAVTELGGIEIAIFNVRGEHYALPNRCPHVGGPLGEGTLTGHTEVTEDRDLTYDETEDVVECPWHCWRFDVTTGTNIDDDRYRVPTFDVEVDDGELFVVI